MAATVFTNGSFEEGPAGLATLTTGSTAIDGWTVTGTDIDSLNGFWQTADGGHTMLDLNGFGPGGIQQSIPTTVGATYVVAFSLSGNPGSNAQYPHGVWSPSNKTLTVTANGGSPTDYSFDTATQQNTTDNMKWAVQTYTFKATSPTTIVKFASTTEGAFGPALDKVEIAQALATGADCKKGGWQGMKDLNGASFKNQGDCVSYYATGGKNLAS